MPAIRSAVLAATALAAATPALGEVNVYTTRQPYLIEPVTDAFTEETGIEVNLAFIRSGIVERLQAEGERSPADLVMTVDIANLSRIVEAGVTQPVESDVLTEGVPEALRGAGGEWFALTSRARVVYASRERVAEGAIETYSDLAEDEWAGRLCTRSGLHNYNLALFSAVIAHKGADAARAWLSDVKDNLARRPQGNDTSQARAIWAGECDVALGNTYYVGNMMEDPETRPWAESLRVVFPEFEDGGTHVNVSGMAMVQSAPNRADAVRLMEYLVSPEAQEIYAEENFEYPVLPAAKVSEMVAGWGELVADTMPLSEIAAERSAAVRLVEEVNFDG